MRTTINLPTAVLDDLHRLAEFNKRTLSSEIGIAVERWLLMNSEVIAQDKTNKKGKTYGSK